MKYPIETKMKDLQPGDRVGSRDRANYAIISVQPGDREGSVLVLSDCDKYTHSNGMSASAEETVWVHDPEAEWNGGNAVKFRAINTVELNEAQIEALRAYFEEHIPEGQETESFHIDIHKGVLEIEGATLGEDGEWSAVE